MSEFSIRSIEFNNANTLEVVDASQASLIGVDNAHGKFVKVPIDNMVSDKLTTGNVTSSGLTMTLNTIDGKYHIGKDYTNIELEKLNVIDICLSRMTNAGCVLSGCTSYCVSVMTTIVAPPST